MPEYVRKPDPYFEATPEEYKLAQQYRLSDAQLCFRRAKLDELGSTDLFKQEYPSTPLESFLTSGRCFVEDAALRDAEDECYTPDFRGDYRAGQMLKHSSGPYKEWCPPMRDDPI